MLNNIQKTTMSILIFLLPITGNAEICQTAIPATTPTDQFADNGDGTVTDTRTGLMWKRCAEEKFWDGSSCNDNQYHPEVWLGGRIWMDALQRAQSVNAGTGGNNLGYIDWRVPNIKELSSIVENQCWVPTSNNSVFPKTSALWYWSSSPDAYSGRYAWGVNFVSGKYSAENKSNWGTVRLVRNGY